MFLVECDRKGGLGRQDLKRKVRRKGDKRKKRKDSKKTIPLREKNT